MTAPTRRRSRRALLLLVGLSAALLVWSNLAVPALAGTVGERTARNAALAVALLVAARAAGLGWHELGLGLGRLPAGARWGLAAGAVVVAGYALALVLPAARPLLEGASAAGASTGELLLAALVTVPLGTVLWEEVAFRGVLQALAHRSMGEGWALVVTSAVFAGWHLHPAAATGPAAVAGVLAVTGVGGVAFAWLRRRSGSLLAPTLLHLATNSLGMLLPALARSLG